MFGISIEQLYKPLSYSNTSNSILIIGEALSGPSEVVTYIPNKQYLQKLFGVTSQIAQCYESIMLVSQLPTVYVVRINGTYSTATLVDEEAITLVTFSSIVATDETNAFTIEIEQTETSTKLTITDNHGIHELEYSNSDFIRNMVRDINVMTRNREIDVCITLFEDRPIGAISATEPTITFSGGTTEAIMDDADKYSRLDEILNMLISMKWKAIAIPCIDITLSTIINAETETFANLLYHNNAVREMDGSSTVYVVPATSNTNFNDDYIYELINSTVPTLVGMSSCRNVVAVTNNVETLYSSDSNAVATGIVAALCAHNGYSSSISNKYITDELALSYNINQDDAKTLANAGISTFTRSIRKGVTVGYAVNMIGLRCFEGYIRISMLVSDLLNNIYSALDNMNTTQISSIINIIEQILARYTEQEAIKDYTFTVHTVLDSVNIDMVIVPFTDIYSVKASLTVGGIHE